MNRNPAFTDITYQELFGISTKMIERFSYSKIINFKIPDSVSIILPDCFSHCTSLTEIQIPNTLTYIGDRAFAGCTALSEVTLPSTLTLIGQYAFHGAGLRSIDIPGTSGSIADGAFIEMPNLTSVTMKPGVSYIGFQAFCSNPKLSQVILPNSIGYIDAYAFSNCPQLTSISFNGTKAEWEAMRKSEDWYGNSPITKIICTDGECPPLNFSIALIDQHGFVSKADGPSKIAPGETVECQYTSTDKLYTNIYAEFAEIEVYTEELYPGFYLYTITISNVVKNSGQEVVIIFED